VLPVWRRVTVHSVSPCLARNSRAELNSAPPGCERVVVGQQPAGQAVLRQCEGSPVEIRRKASQPALPGRLPKPGLPS
jgi:hypothetical protein